MPKQETNLAHIGQLMGNALVAVDAGLVSVDQEAFVGLCGAKALAGKVHRVFRVAVAAFQTIIGLHARPFPAGQLHPLFKKLFAGAYGAEDMAPNLFRSLDFACHFAGPIVGNVAVRALCPHTGAIGVVDGAFELGENVGFHFMTTGAERLGVGELHGGVEPTPENNAS